MNARIVYAYSRSQAVADGVQVEVTKRNDSVEEGIATVPVAAIGVSPMASACRDIEPFGALPAISIWSARRRPVRARGPRSPKHN